MKINTRGFTLIELMIVMLIISILAGTVYLSIQPYLARSRDTKRVQEVRSLATVLGAYKQTNNEQMPNNNTGFTVEYCLSTLLSWNNGSTPDRKYKDLLDNIKHIPQNTNVLFGASLCTDPSSLFYNRLIDGSATQYGLLAVRMETPQSVTYLTGADFNDNTKILDLMNNTTLKGLDLNTINTGSQAPLYHILVN